MKWTNQQIANICVFSLIAAFASQGCGTSRPALTPNDTNPVSVNGTWQHVPAAVQAAVGPNEFAVVIDNYSESGNAAIFKLIGVQGVHAELVIQVQAGEIAVRAIVESSLKKNEHERMLVRDVKIRLEQLREKGFAPLPPGWE